MSGDGENGPNDPTRVASGGVAGGADRTGGGDGAGAAADGTVNAATRGGDINNDSTTHGSGGGGGVGRIGIDLGAACSDVDVSRFSPQPNCR
jgi:hypothetical protein